GELHGSEWAARADNVRIPQPEKRARDMRRLVTCAAVGQSRILIQRQCPGFEVMASTGRLAPSSAWAMNFSCGIQKSRLKSRFSLAASFFSVGLRRDIPTRPRCR